jgi:hypothetical protein
MANNEQEQEISAARRALVLEGRADGDSFSFVRGSVNGVEAISLQQARLNSAGRMFAENDVIATLAEMSARNIATRTEEREL